MRTRVYVCVYVHTKIFLFSFSFVLMFLSFFLSLTLFLSLVFFDSDRDFLVFRTPARHIIAALVSNTSCIMSIELVHMVPNQLL